MALSEISVVIPTFNREKELTTCVESLNDEALDIQWIVLRERGPLVRLRNEGLRRARAPITLFIDDDIVASPGYLRGVLSQMDRLGCLGLTGPGIIPEAYRGNRDLYKYRFLRKLYDWCFVGAEKRPGQITIAGTFVPDPDWSYEGPVQYLEACHMSFKTEALKAIGGFDEAYGGIGDWSEPDCAFRLRQRFGDDCLAFEPRVAVEHRCSPAGATVFRRADAGQRLSNYHLFARRWVRPTVRHHLYQLFLWGYYRGYHGWLNRVSR